MVRQEFEKLTRERDKSDESDERRNDAKRQRVEDFDYGSHAEVNDEEAAEEVAMAVATGSGSGEWEESNGDEHE